MSKPSIFSRDYKQRMKRRKLNIVLFLLLLVCIAFFGGRYYLKKNNISIFKNSPVKKQEVVEVDKNSNVNNNSSKLDKPQPKPSVLEYTYTLNNKKALKLEYIVNGENKELKGFKNENLDLIEYSISPNKKNAVFVDKTNQSLILVDTEGEFTEITKQNVVYSNGKKLTRKILNSNEDYIWNSKPQFTEEGNIVYISDMPNFKPGSKLTLWATKPKKDAKHTKIAELSKDISVHNFEGFDEEGRLKLNTPNGYIYISKDGYTAMK